MIGFPDISNGSNASKLLHIYGNINSFTFFSDFNKLVLYTRTLFGIKKLSQESVIKNI